MGPRPLTTARPEQEPSPPPKTRLLLTLMVGVALLSMAAYRWSAPVIDPDLWHELALAREIWATGSVPMADSFAYTPTIEPVVHHEWGAGVIALALANGLGAPGIVLLRLLLSSALLALCWVNARTRGANLATLSFLAPIAILLADGGFSPVRAQMYSFVGVALLLTFLEVDRTGRRWWIVAWLPLYTLWLNVHAGFVVGAGLLALHWAEQLVRRRPHWHLFFVGIGMLLLILVNPYGLHYPRYLIGALTLSRPLVAEWGPLWQAEPLTLTLFVGSVALWIYSVVFRPGGATMGWPLLLITALASVNGSRFLPFYAIVWVCYVPAAVVATPIGTAASNLWNRSPYLMSAVWTASALLMATMAVSARPWALTVPGQPPASGDSSAAYYPVGAVRYLRDQGFAGNLMTPFDWGAYVSWRLHPNVKVAIDSRYEAVYPPSLADELFGFYMAHAGWEEVLERYPSHAILVPTRLPLAQALPDAPGWRPAYQDDAFEIYVRQDSVLPYVDARGAVFYDRFP